MSSDDQIDIRFLVNVTGQDLQWHLAKHKYTSNVRWSAHCKVLETGEKLTGGWPCLLNKYEVLCVPTIAPLYDV
jgi:hypothetical protein